MALHVTHPRLLFLLTFLVSSVAKRDAVGRKPKRKVFATEGVSAWEREIELELIRESIFSVPERTAPLMSRSAVVGQ